MLGGDHPPCDRPDCILCFPDDPIEFPPECMKCLRATHRRGSVGVTRKFKDRRVGWTSPEILPD